MMLVIGHKGMLGSDVMAAAKGVGYEVWGVDFPEIDITRIETVREWIGQTGARVIVNCAGYTAVDACETNRDAAFAVNALGTGNIARCAGETGGVFVHYSTDYVFDGTKKGAYVESDAPNPASVYGKSKLEGERLAAEACEKTCIIRIAWLYGLHGNNFVKTIRNVARKNAQTGTPLKVVNDQVGSPTCTTDVCRQTLRLIETGNYGLYHATSEGRCSWFDFANEIVKAAGIPVPVLPCTTAEFPRPAPRPANSVLENERLKKLGINVMPDWKKGFEEFLKSEK